MRGALSLLDDNDYQDVEGWLNLKVLKVLHAWAEVYKEEFLGTQDFGAALEIGVHHGKFLLGIESEIPNDVACFAIDLYDGQEKNIDRSGKGNREVFVSHVNKIARNPSRVIPVELDSFSIRRCVSLPSEFSVISIDGGHTREHVGHDLTQSLQRICLKQTLGSRFENTNIMQQAGSHR